MDTYGKMYVLSQLPTHQSIKINQLYHILKGKRTASNLYQASHLRLLPIFSLNENIEKKELLSTVREWQKNGWIQFEDEEVFVLSEKGQKAVDYYFEPALYPDSIQMGRFSKSVSLFWERIQLLTQVFSYKRYEKNDYSPIMNERPTQVWVKHWLHEHSSDSLPEQFGIEMGTILRQMTDANAAFIACSLTGYTQIGWTASQRANKFGHEKEESDLLFLNALHCFFQFSLTNSNCPLLQEVASQSDEDTYQGLSGSTYQTLYYIQKGLTPEQIAQQRSLKEGTIWEHVIEWAVIHPESTYTSLIPHQIYEEIYEKLSRNPSLEYADLTQDYPGMPFAWYRLIQIERKVIHDKGKNA